MKEVRPKNIKAAAVITEVEDYDDEMQEVELDLTRMEPFRVSSRCVEESNPESHSDVVTAPKSPHDAIEDDEDEEDFNAKLEMPIKM